MYYSSYGVLSLILHFIINFDVLRNKNRANFSPALRSYRRFLVAVTVYYVCDVLWGFLYEWGLIVPAYIDTVLYFLAMALSVFLWTRFVITYLDNNDAFSRLVTWGGWLIVILQTLVLALNLLTPIMFYFDGDGNYIATGFRYVVLAVQVVLFLAAAAYTLVNTVRVEEHFRGRYRAVGLSGLTMTIFIVLQSVFPLLPFYAIGCLITICVIHTFLSNNMMKQFSYELGATMHKAYTDSLTGVNNARAYIETKAEYDRRILSSIQKEFGVIVFDINGLKEVNDRLGHDAGDRYIKSACGMICEFFSRCPIYRIGGDEFVVLLEGDDYFRREELLKRFEHHADVNRIEGRVILADGMAEYMPDEDREFDTVFMRADQNMYERKRSLKSGRKR